MRDAAGELDDLDAALQFAERVGMGLAMLARNLARHLVGVLVQEFGEPEKNRRALGGGQIAPGRLRLFGVLHRRIDFGHRGQRHRADLLAGGRIEHRSGAGGSGERALAADRIV